MRKAFVVTDLTYGDAGKGSVVDYLARTEGATLVVRFNGGPQAAHNVITPDGRHHTFSQFGAASFLPGALTHLSRFMLVNPLLLLQEAEALAGKGVPDALDRISIDARALVITPYHQAANRLREIHRGAGRHGSCGMGIGETMADWVELGDEMLRAGDLADFDLAEKKLELMRLRKLTQLEDIIGGLPDSPEVRAELTTLEDEELSTAVAEFFVQFAGRIPIVPEGHLARLLREHDRVIFEGAQGVLLDEWYGFHPFTTWSTTTTANADTLLLDGRWDGEVVRLGLLRGYLTRHGAGPFVTEDSGLTDRIPDLHNGTNRWQEGFRVGYLDLVALRYALDLTGPLDGLVVSGLDRMYGEKDLKVARNYAYQGEPGSRPAGLGQEGPVKRIIRCEAPDLDYQQALTDGLLACRAVYEEFGEFTPDRTEEYLRLIEEALGVPVVLSSAGPTAKDKTPRHP